MSEDKKTEGLLAVQTMAKILAEDAKAIGESGCLAACYGYIAGAPETSIAFVIKLATARQGGIIDKECNVYDAERFLSWWTDGKRHFKVKKVPIAGGDISGIKELTPVRFLAEGHGGHWVVVKDGKIVFNPLAYSYNVEHGTAVDSRVIEEV